MGQREAIKELLHAKDLTLSALAKECGLNHAYFQQFIERGTPRELPDRTLRTLEQKFGVEREALRDGRLIFKPAPGKLPAAAATPGRPAGLAHGAPATNRADSYVIRRLRDGTTSVEFLAGDRRLTEIHLSDDDARQLGADLST